MDLVAIDSVGVEVARSDTPVAVYTMPWPCDDGNTCFSGYLDGADEYGEWQVSVQEGNISVTERPPVDPTDIPVLDGVSVREVTIDGEDRLRRIDSGDVRWERSFEELGLTTGRDAVAGGTRYADAVYIHNIYYTDEEWSAELEIPLADHQLIALDLDSGEELWRRRGAGLCGGATDDVSRVVLVCEGSGNATVDYTTGLLTFSEATKVSVAGVDEHTGQELWSRDITGEDWTANRSSAATSCSSPAMRAVTFRPRRLPGHSMPCSSTHHTTWTS